MRRLLVVSTIGLLVAGLMLGSCRQAQPAYTPTPTKTQLSDPAPTAAVPATPVPVAAPVLHAPPTATPTAELGAPSILVSEPSATATPAPVLLTPPSTATEPAAPPMPTQEPPTATLLPETSPVTETPAPQSGPVLPPQRGGSWDMEDGFYVWPSPYENYGGFVADGWGSFVRAYQPDADPPNAPRLNENKREDNVQSGQRSQEVSFDYRTGTVGILRTATVTPGHHYTVEAWAKYAPSASGLQLDLGIDPTGGTDFEAGTVTWYPWRDVTPDHWIATQETVRATGDRMTIYLRAVHAVPEVGGNTMFDNVSLIDRGP